MATMTKFASVKLAIDAAKKDIMDALSCGMTPPASYSILRPDGDTDEVSWSRRYEIIDRRRHAGHLTLGMNVSASDLPCMIVP